MNTDGYYNFWSNSKTTLALQSISMPILLSFIWPLYQYSKTRNPILLVVNKLIGMIISLLIGLIQSWMSVFGYYPTWLTWVLVVGSVPYIGARTHLLGMAFNRFYFVFFPYKYVHMNKRRNVQKMSAALWLAAIILTPPSNYIGLNGIRYWPWLIFLRTNIEQICIYSALLFYVLMAAKLIWMKWNSSANFDGGALEKDSYKISAACIVGIIPFLLGIFSLMLMQTFIGMGIYWSNPWLTDLLITTNIPFLNVANFSEEICLWLLASEFRRHVRTNLRRIFARLLWIITLGNYKMLDTTATTVNAGNMAAANLLITTTNNKVHTITNVNVNVAAAVGGMNSRSNAWELNRTTRIGGGMARVG